MIMSVLFVMLPKAKARFHGLYVFGGEVIVYLSGNMLVGWL